MLLERARSSPRLWPRHLWESANQGNLRHSFVEPGCTHALIIVHTHTHIINYTRACAKPSLRIPWTCEWLLPTKRPINWEHMRRCFNSNQNSGSLRHSFTIYAYYYYSYFYSAQRRDSAINAFYAYRNDFCYAQRRAFFTKLSNDRLAYGLT